ncbi:MAG: SRPBCC family protein [Parvibaculum sp.]|uniref:SRPBCC family protein n=1 Tax=Parvibaculum sp. TaxID=2024848 RepID=UPI00283D8C42|nr:SRPBCC family protein [Parvibaculum sp.]MDR3499501.1 SRPBCC family protein [Parvibaculum sp.]
MLKTIIVIAAVIAVAIAALFIYAATRPDSFSIQRSATIKAGPERIFGFIDDFREWTKWSPYEQVDADLKRSYSGAEHGVGAVYSWSGKKIGDGRMEILESDAPSRIVIKLDFMSPFEAHNIAQFTLSPKGDATEVTWEMHGPSSFFSKVAGVFFNIDKIVGKDFEAGLNNLKAAAEQGEGK